MLNCMKNYSGIIMAVVLLILHNISPAQQTAGNLPPLTDEQTTRDLFNKQKYGAVRDYSSNLTPADELLTGFEASKEYYATASAAKLQHADATAEIKAFLDKYPENTRSNRAWFELANLEFKNSSFRPALEAYSKVDTYDMTAEEKAEYTFKQGYCFFRTGDTDKAADNFYRIKEQQTRYTGPANYYYAHIMYSSGRYETALRDFEKLREDETFKNVVPFYIIQIYYLQGRYDEMLELAKPYLKGQHNKRTNEILRLAADVSYRRGNYDDAISFMEEYRNANRAGMTRQEDYLLAFSYYKTGKYDKAIPEFQAVTTGNDTLAQNASYHLGDCYLKTNQKKFASGAFLAAWKMPVRSEVAENALFNYAKLSIELSYNPYNEAIRALQDYLNEYPKSTRRDEAFTYLANLYMVTKNYKEALATLENVNKRNAQQNAIFQKISYFRGLELFADNAFFDAIGQFKKATETKADDQIAAAATFWTAESYFRLGQYDIAEDYYTKSRKNPVKAGGIYNSAGYGLGYSLFKQKKYKEARQAFTAYIDSRPEDLKMLNDARVRIADCYFMQRQYADAIRQYDQVVQARGADADYALYQKSIACGVTGDAEGKLATLQQLLSTFPKSTYCDEARYESGRTLVSLQRNDDALKAFQRVITDYPKSSLVKNALLNSGLVYYNTNRDQKALETFKKVVKDYPSTPEAREALAVIRNIYVDMNQVDTYVEYTADIPFANVSKSEQDSLTYTAVENRYMEGDCAKALPGFIGYIQKFPSGIYSANANYYKADCETRAGKTAEALKSYEFILSQPRNKFTENAALKASEILYSTRDYANALVMYQRLEENAENKANLTEAITGQMRCQYYTGNFGLAIQNAQRLLLQDKVSEMLAAEANLITGNSAKSLRRNDQAIDAYNQTLRLTKGEAAAEALYNIAEIHFDQKDYTTAEKEIFRLTGDFASYDYWVAKAFILLSDVYIKTGNTFQAKQTLQSIIDNYEGADLRKLAADKLRLINAAEADHPKTGNTGTDDDGIIIK